MKTTQTRSTGEKLTYDVEVNGHEYVISLGGKELKRARAPEAPSDKVSVEETALALAVEDIEDLKDMSER